MAPRANLKSLCLVIFFTPPSHFKLPPFKKQAALRTVTAQLLVVADECEKSSWERDLLTQKLERAEMDAKELQAKYLEVNSAHV